MNVEVFRNIFYSYNKSDYTMTQDIIHYSISIGKNIIENTTPQKTANAFNKFVESQA